MQKSRARRPQGGGRHVGLREEGNPTHAGLGSEVRSDTRCHQEHGGNRACVDDINPFPVGRESTLELLREETDPSGWGQMADVSSVRARTLASTSSVPRARRYHRHLNTAAE